MLFLFRLFVNMIAILIIAYLLPGLISVDGIWSALVAAFVLGLINALLKPIVVFVTFPVTLLTFGLFLLLINAFILWLVSTIVKGFHVNGFSGAFLGSLLVSLVSWFLSSFIWK